MAAKIGSAAELVSRHQLPPESIEKLETYAALLRKWQTRINLVGPATMDDVWGRHFLDSAQLWLKLREAGKLDRRLILVDLGTGAGFPGLVLAMLGGLSVHLVDSDKRKMSFVRQVLMETKVSAELHTDRIETIAGLEVDLVTARACAPLAKLVGWGQAFLRPGGQMWFLKGGRWREELTTVAESWTVRTYESVTDPTAALLQLVRDKSKGDC